MSSINEILKKYWSHDAFRPLQEDIINSVLEGKDTLVLLPTGGGKSICFQVPALATEGICIVVSPLIALMKDQVRNLKERGIKAIAVVSGMHRKEIDIALDNCIYGKIKFLYLSPERLTSELVRERITKMNVSILAVDEAHCISQWGYDFRPPYLKIAEIRELLPEVPVIALTATATPEVVKDIKDKLLFKNGNTFQKSFERNNLAYVVLHEENKQRRLLKIINNVAGTGIVYVRNRKKTRDIAALLKKNGITADFYHAGLDSFVRDQRQQAWINGKCRVIVSTNAFGMGIDKPDVRFVVHMDLPDSPEAYFQEAGRAGRDGIKSYAVLLYNQADKLNFERNFNTRFPDRKEIKNVYQALANHFQLAIGSGHGQSYNFDIAEFSLKYNMKPTLVFSCLNFLEQEGYLIKTEAVNLPSRVHLSVNKENLHAFQVENQQYDAFIKTLLRSYSGVFDDYVNINETEIGNRTGLSKDRVIELLTHLDACSVLSYLPQNDAPQIIFNTPRVDVKQLMISKEHYEQRKKAVGERMQAMLNYAAAGSTCNSRFLLEYFGESNTKPCGLCNVCLEYNNQNVNSQDYHRVSDELKEAMEIQPLTLEELVNSVKFQEDRTLKVIQWLVDNEKMSYTHDNKLTWNE